MLKVTTSIVVVLVIGRGCPIGGNRYPSVFEKINGCRRPPVVVKSHCKGPYSNHSDNCLALV